MKKKDVDTIIYKESSFKEIAERVYILLLELRAMKKLDHLHLVLDATVKDGSDAKESKLRKIFKKRVKDTYYKPYETVSVKIEDMEILPYSFEALLEEIRLQNANFGECHSLRISLYPSKKSHSTTEFNDIWVYTEALGEDGRNPVNLKALRFSNNSNTSITVYLSIPSIYEKELFRLEQKLFKAAKNSKAK